MSANATVRKAVEQRAADEAEAQMVLDALGLVAEDGSTPPDDTKEYNLGDLTGKSPGPKTRSVVEPPERVRGMTTPPGLACLAVDPAEAAREKSRAKKADYRRRRRDGQ